MSDCGIMIDDAIHYYLCSVDVKQQQKTDGIRYSQMINTREHALNLRKVHIFFQKVHGIYHRISSLHPFIFLNLVGVIK